MVAVMGHRATLAIRLAAFCCLTVASAVFAAQDEEQALLSFAEQFTNIKAVSATAQWQGWGSDNNTLCPEAQQDTYQELLCEGSYPSNIQHARQSWTGITCTPDGHVICLNLAGWGLEGSAHALELLSPLRRLQMVNLAHNSLTGTLPASLPAALRAFENAFPSIEVVYLSHNNLKGRLPALWGDDTLGWGPSLSRLYLDNNQLTGTLPQLWSDSDSLWSLGRLDLFKNQLTGEVTWTSQRLPSLGDLVLLPGNDFCGSVPDDMAGTVRHLVGEPDGAQLLYEVQEFRSPCPPAAVIHRHPMALPNAMLAGISAATAVILLVALLSIQALRQRTTSPFSLDQSSQDSFDKPAKLAVSAAISSSSAPSSSDSSTACEADPLMSGTPAMEQTSMLPTHERDSLPNTMYFTLQYVSSQLALHSMSHAMPPVTADQACSRIPAPLWQEVHIQAQDICIAQNAAGKDWLLGEGSSGKVFKGIMHGVHDVAIKVFCAPSSQRDVQLLHTEIAILRSCNNKNIVQFRGVCFRQPDVWLVMERLEKGSLFDLLARKSQKYTWYHRGGAIALDVAKGVYFLHSHRIMHLDLKSPNILLSADNTAKIADVGLAHVFTLHSLPAAKKGGTFHWMAPELMSGGKCTEKADIFSFGVVLYEILKADQPIRGRMKPIRVPQHCPQAVHDIMISCLQEQPDRRPTAAQLVHTIAQNLASKSDARRPPG